MRILDETTGKIWTARDIKRDYTESRAAAPQTVYDNFFMHISAVLSFASFGEGALQLYDLTPAEADKLAEKLEHKH